MNTFDFRKWLNKSPNNKILWHTLFGEQQSMRQTRYKNQNARTSIKKNFMNQDDDWVKSKMVLN